MRIDVSARVPCTPLYVERVAFSPTEVFDIQTMAQSSVQMQIWIGQFRAASSINPADPELEAGLDACVAATMLSGARKAEIMAMIQAGMPRNWNGL